MKVLFEKNLKLKLVETKTGTKLLVLEEDPNHFWLEQNPLKDSKYGVAYRLLKKQYPDLYMFWEIKNNKFTGKVKLEFFLNKQELDDVIDKILLSSEYTNYKDIQENEIN